MAARWRGRRAFAAWRAYAAHRREGRLATLRACSIRFPGAAAAQDGSPTAESPAPQVRAASRDLNTRSGLRATAADNPHCMLAGVASNSSSQCNSACI